MRYHWSHSHPCACRPQVRALHSCTSNILCVKQLQALLRAPLLIPLQTLAEKVLGVSAEPELNHRCVKTSMWSGKTKLLCVCSKGTVFQGFVHLRRCVIIALCIAVAASHNPTTSTSHYPSSFSCTRAACGVSCSIGLS